MQPVIIMIALFVSFLWGVQPILHKYALGTVTPVFIMAASSIVYFICMIFFIAYNFKHLVVQTKLAVTRPNVLLVIVVASFITAFLANLLYLFILRDNSSYAVSALIYSAPAFTLLVSLVFLYEGVTIMGVLGVIAIVCGVILLAKG